MNINKSLPPGWLKEIGFEFEKPYMAKLFEFLKQKDEAKEVYFPKKEDIFAALRAVDYPEVKVVILGQDPYHGKDQANGLAFAVNRYVPVPPSLKNIFKELKTDLGLKDPLNPNLLGWAKQGVLLLNTVLTVDDNKPFSHRDKGWELFTEKILESLNCHPQNLVFILWGKPAQKKTFEARHQILKSAHPSPLSAYRGFFGSKPFSQCNEFLISQGQSPIIWDKSF